MEDVRRLLASSGGVARRRDLLRAGLGRRRLARLVREGELRLLTPGVLAAAPVPGVDEALRAAVVGLHATASHGSAARLWGMELARAPERVHVTVARNRSRVSRAGCAVHRADLAPHERQQQDGLWVTTPLRTVLDLCRSLPLQEAVAVTDSALRCGLVTVEELVGALRDLPAGVGRPRVVQALRLVDPQCGSVLESLCRVLLHLAGMPPEATQHVVRTPTGRWIGRVDFAWLSARLVVETDGYAFHADRASYRRDRRRSNALVLAGWQVLRFSWEDVVHAPDEVVATVRQALRARAEAHTA